MTPLKFMLLISAMVLMAVPASAWDGVQAVEACGYLTRWVAFDSSPTPGYCDWRTAEPAGPAFHATNADGAGNFECDDPWFVHCDQDSLVYRGVWPAMATEGIDASHYEAVFTGAVNVVARTLLKASRSVTGNLTLDIHALTLEYPDGTMVPVLPAGGGPDQAELILDPGIYRVSLVIDAYQAQLSGNFLDAYEGQVRLQWDDPANVAVESAGWGTIKAMFR